MTQETQTLDPKEYCFGQGGKGFITLWRLNKYGATFIKNVAKTQEKADELYPGLEQRYYRGTYVSFDDSGRRYDTGTFQFGRHHRTLIADCDDLSYIKWYMGCIPTDSPDYKIALDMVKKDAHKITPEEREMMEEADFFLTDDEEYFIPSALGLYDNMTWERFAEVCAKRIERKRKTESLIDVLESGEDLVWDINNADYAHVDGKDYFAIYIAPNVRLAIRNITEVSNYYYRNLYAVIDGKRKQFLKHACTISNIEYLGISTYQDSYGNNHIDTYYVGDIVSIGPKRSKEQSDDSK